MKPFLPALLALALPAFAQGLTDEFKKNHSVWEESLGQGQGASVRKATEALLQQEAVTVNPSDYNAMHAMEAVLNLTARACVLEGAWEDAVDYLAKASQTASDNANAAQGTFARLIAEHQEKLQQWRPQVAQQEQRLRLLEAQSRPSSEQLKLKAQIQQFLDEHRHSIAHSEMALKEIDSLLVLLDREKDAYAASLTEWRGFLAKERADIASLGSVNTYATDKLDQVMADDARPRTERLAYARRLLRLDPSNKGCQRFVDELEGLGEPPALPPRRRAK